MFLPMNTGGGDGGDLVYLGKVTPTTTATDYTISNMGDYGYIVVLFNSATGTDDTPILNGNVIGSYGANGVHDNNAFLIAPYKDFILGNTYQLHTEHNNGAKNYKVKYVNDTTINLYRSDGNGQAYIYGYGQKSSSSSGWIEDTITGSWSLSAGNNLWRTYTFPNLTEVKAIKVMHFTGLCGIYDMEFETNKVKLHHQTRVDASGTYRITALGE